MYLPNHVVVPEIRVTEAPLTGDTDVLVGMDVIGIGDFAVTNKDGKTVFSFRLPSVECLDFVEQSKKQRTSKPQVGPYLGVGRNAPCPCGSGRKYKNCCLRKEARPPK
jgi:hypothetical protein